jgi:hypothetical protein
MKYKVGDIFIEKRNPKNKVVIVAINENKSTLVRIPYKLEEINGIYRFYTNEYSLNVSYVLDKVYNSPLYKALNGD